MRKVIYIAHPFLGKPENVQKVEKIILKLIEQYPDYTFYSPLYATGFFYFKSYEEGMKDCALRCCDGQTNYGFALKGVRAEAVTWNMNMRKTWNSN